MPAPSLPSLSTDQLAAFVELARQGSLRTAAETLFITEQGIRSRLIALEERLGVELYRKSRGMRKTTPLTAQGKRLLPHAMAFLERAKELRDLFVAEEAGRDVGIVLAIPSVLGEVELKAVAVDPASHAGRPGLSASWPGHATPRCC